MRSSLTNTAVTAHEVVKRNKFFEMGLIDLVASTSHANVTVLVAIKRPSHLQAEAVVSPPILFLYC